MMSTKEIIKNSQLGVQDILCIITFVLTTFGSLDVMKIVGRATNAELGLWVGAGVMMLCWLVCGLWLDKLEKGRVYEDDEDYYEDDEEDF